MVSAVAAVGANRYVRFIQPVRANANTSPTTAPTIDLVVGYHKANTSPILRMFLSRIDDLTTRVSGKARRMSGPESAATPRA